MHHAGKARVRHLQCNVQGTDPEHIVERHITAQLEHADVIVWNELTSLASQRFVHGLSRIGWSSYLPGYDGKRAHAASAVGISWRTHLFKVEERDTRAIVKGVRRITPTRVVNVVRLQHVETGRWCYFLGTHVVHHIEGGGRALLRHTISGQNARAKKLFTYLGGVTQRLGRKGPLVASGDLNVSWQAEKHLAPARRTKWFPLTVLTKAGAHIVAFSHGTHGGRGIDWVWTAGPVKTIDERVLPRGSSDHNPRLTVHEF